MINKKVESEIAIGLIVIIALIMGSLIWMKNTNRYASSADVRDKAEVGATDSVVFIGDSITAIENWNALLGTSYVANAGISGNTTDDVIARLDRAIVYKPKKIFLMIGVNDFLRGRDVAHVLANYEIILNSIRKQSPDTVIYIESVLPINNDLSKIGTIDSQKIITLNRQLKKFIDGKKILFIDLYPSFCGDDSKLYRKYTVDGVHLSAAGYGVWKNAIYQYVKF
ncbi:MAG: hypothetical protein HGA36_00300 [Candidatus Moranbacteria bacterium]|nr:hypothetical protein [Candidatus Moranbacteria bacterium]